MSILSLRVIKLLFPAFFDQIINANNSVGIFLVFKYFVTKIVNKEEKILRYRKEAPIPL